MFLITMVISSNGNLKNRIHQQDKNVSWVLIDFMEYNSVKAEFMENAKVAHHKC